MDNYKIKQDLGIEDINFQNNNFLNELAFEIKNLYNEYLQNSDKNKIFNSKQKEIINICKIIKKYTNINLTIDINEYKWIGVTLPLNTNNHIFQNYNKKIFGKIDYDLKEYILLEKKEIKETKSYVDLDNAKVYGFFSEMFSILNIDFKYLFKLLNNLKEFEKIIASIILHEVGHVFTTFEFVDRNISTNNVLQFISNVKKTKFSFEKKKYFIDDVTNIKKDDLDKIINAKTEEETAFIYFGLEKEKSISQLGNDIYDLVGCEQLADNFAVKFGAGKHLAIGLEKLELDNSFNPYLGLILLSSLFPFTLATSLISYLVIGLCTLLLFTTYYFIGSTIRYKPIEEYDDLETRINRIINTNVERIKDKNISDEMKLILLDENKTMRELVNKNKVNKPLFKIVKEFFSKKVKTDADFIKMQKQLEQIGSNILFEKAATLSLIK